MFVQTHFQRNRHQAGLAPQNSQQNINCKSPKYVSSDRSNKRAETKARKYNETIIQGKFDIGTKELVKKSKPEWKLPVKVYSSSSTTHLNLITDDACHKMRSLPLNHDQRSRDPRKLSTCKSMGAAPSSKCNGTYQDSLESGSIMNLNVDLNFDRRFLVDDKSNPHNFINAQNMHCFQQSSHQIELSKNNYSKISSSVMAIFSGTLTNISKSLSSKLFNNNDTKVNITKTDPQIIVNLIREHLELVVTFSVNLVSYQLETWRLMLDDNHNVLKKEQNAFTRGCCMSSNRNLDNQALNSSRIPEDLVNNSRISDSSMETLDNEKQMNREFFDCSLLRKLPGGSPFYSSRSMIACDSLIPKFDHHKVSNENHNLHVDDSGSYIDFGKRSSDAGRPNYSTIGQVTQLEVGNKNDNCNLAALTTVNSIDLSHSSEQVRNHVDLGVATTKSIDETDSNLERGDIDMASGSKMRSSRKLSLTGTKGRIWFSRKKSDLMIIRRSEEILPEFKNMTVSNSSNDNGVLSVVDSNQFNTPSGSSSDKGVNFIEGLGVGQIVFRHALVSSVVGEIQLYLTDIRGVLEVAVIQARGLHHREVDKDLPSTYAKVYLIRDKKCIAKYKTMTIPQTSDPLYQQKFIYRLGHSNCMMQVIVWGESSKRSKKSLLGTAQIQLDQLDLSKSIVSWYKLIDVPSIVGPFVSSRSLRRRLLSITTVTTGS